MKTCHECQVSRIPQEIRKVDNEERSLVMHKVTELLRLTTNFENLRDLMSKNQSNYVHIIIHNSEQFNFCGDTSAYGEVTTFSHLT